MFFRKRKLARLVVREYELRQEIKAAGKRLQMTPLPKHWWQRKSVARREAERLARNAYREWQHTLHWLAHYQKGQPSAYHQFQQNREFAKLSRHAMHGMRYHHPKATRDPMHNPRGR